jgi:hypothetical protein
MSRPLTDRQRIEQMLFIDQLTHIVRDGAADVRERETALTLQCLGRAREETEAGLTRSELDKMERRLRRADADALSPLRRVAMPIAAFGLVVFVILRDLAESSYLAPVAGSPLDEALQRILPALEAAAAEPGALPAAERSAARAIRTLEAAGYLVGFRTLTEA